MPILKTKDVGKTIKFLRKEKPGIKYSQALAIALDVARKAGAKLTKK